MGLFPDDFSMHLIRSLLTVLPNFTSHEHYTVSSIFRALSHFTVQVDTMHFPLHGLCQWMCVCTSSFSSRFSSSLMCCCLHVWQSGSNTKNIFIFYHKWKKKKSEQQFHIWFQRQNLPLLKLSALLPEPSCPASTGEVQQLFWAQKQKSWVAFSKGSIASWFAPSPMCAGKSFIMGWKVKKGKEASIECP